MATKTRRPVAADECVPAAEALARAFRFLGKRWNAVVLGQLSAGPAGFRELSRAIDGISDSVLSDRLADLAGGGLITRTVSDGPPLSVSYALTDRGRALMPALEQIANWARDNLSDRDDEAPAGEVRPVRPPARAARPVGRSTTGRSSRRSRPTPG
jgi:DNA-binding HxlR family transcriptional regulator